MGWKNIDKQPTITLINHQNPSEENIALTATVAGDEEGPVLFYVSKLWQARVWVQINWHFQTIHNTHVTTPRTFFKKIKLDEHRKYEKMLLKNSIIEKLVHYKV